MARPNTSAETFFLILWKRKEADGWTALPETFPDLFRAEMKAALVVAKVVKIVEVDPTKGVAKVMQRVA